MDYGAAELGSKPKSDKGGDKEAAFEEVAGTAAVRGLVKGLGLDPDSVDLERVNRALRAVVASCKGGDEY